MLFVQNPHEIMYKIQFLVLTNLTLMPLAAGQLNFHQNQNRNERKRRAKKINQKAFSELLMNEPT